MNTKEQVVRDIIVSHLECELTEENGWSVEIVEYLKKLVQNGFKITILEEAE